VSLPAKISLSAQKCIIPRPHISNVLVKITGVGSITFRLSSTCTFITHPYGFLVQKNATAIINFLIWQSSSLNSKIFSPYVGNLMVER